MGNILSLLISAIIGAIHLIQSIRSLVDDRRFFPRRVTVGRPVLFQIEHEPLREKNMIEFQIEIEKLFHKNQLFPRIRQEIMNNCPIDLVGHMKAFQIKEDFGIDLLVQMTLHKRAALPVLVGLLRKHFDGDCQRTTDELYKAVEVDLVDWSPVSKQFITKFNISSDVQEEIDRYQYPLPMVVEPQELKSNRSSAYYMNVGSVILKDNHHDEDVCLEHLNRCNKIRFRLNQDVANTIRNKWKGLDRPKEDDEPGEYEKRVKAFQKYNRTAHDVINHLGLANEGEFYLTHKYDKRGRTYCQGYHVNYQGATWNKAVIQFAHKELVEG